MIPIPLHAGTAVAASAALGLAFAPHLGVATAASAAAVLTGALSVANILCWRLDLLATRFIVGSALLLAVALTGFAIGQMRLSAIDSGTFAAPVGERVSLSGHLISPPRPNGADLRLHLTTPRGRVAILAHQLDSTPPVGAGLRIRGHVEDVPEYLREHLGREGITTLIRAERIEAGDARGGIPGLLDRVRERALGAIGAGMPAREAALASGFVLGQDGDIDATTETQFRRSGLAHLVAASGQNVMLLILLGTVPMILAGVSLRRRVPFLIALVLTYLPLTGAGPSIQRAAVMGIVMLVMVWLSGFGPRLFALALAAALTLAANPRATGDVGWQLSFAASAGIMLLGPDLRGLILAVRLFNDRAASASKPDQSFGDALRRALADGAAVTVAATLATAPLIAHHFGALPLGSLSANLLALPAVAPAMWLGMISGIIGQLPELPTTAINWLNGFLIAYIAEVAAAISDLPGAVIDVDFGPAWLVAVVEAMLMVAAWTIFRRLRRADRIRNRGGRLILLVMALATLIPIASILAPAELISPSARTPSGLRIVALDVGQGDAILIQIGSENLLIDTGPPEAGLVAGLKRYGVDRLEAVFITHGDLDHRGGLEEVRRGFEIGRVFESDPLSESTKLLAAGQRMSLNEAQIDVLWPPGATTIASSERNSHSLVLRLHWRGFTALFSGDAEAEAAAYSPGDIDLLKVAHHGSADAGLPALLAEATPEIALISAGQDNRHGHPHPSTLRALADAAVRVHRTDLEGDLVFELP